MAVKRIPVNDDLGEMLNWAVRYALGRMTYAVSDTCRFVTPLIPYLDDKTLCCMLQDIEEQKRFGYGHDCDERNWMDLKESLRKEIVDNRGITPWPTINFSEDN